MTDSGPLALGSFGMPGGNQSTSGLTQAKTEALQQAFIDIKRAVRQISFNRHRPEAFGGWMSGAFESLALLLRSGTLELAIEVSTLTCEGTNVLEDDQRELNIVYPLFQEGVRLLVFKPGLTLNELIVFYMGVCELDDPDLSDDLLTRLWKESFEHIEWVVVSLEEQSGTEADEEELEQIRNFVEDQQSIDTGGTGSYFAKIGVQELESQLGQVVQLRTTTETGGEADEALSESLQRELEADDERLLDKVCALLIATLRLPIAEHEAPDILTALQRVFDGLILAGKFSAIRRLLAGLEELSRNPQSSSTNLQLYRDALTQLSKLMSEPRRVRALLQVLQSGDPSALDTVSDYVSRLLPDAVPALLDVVEQVKDGKQRRMIAEATATVSRGDLQEVMNRLEGARPDFARELLYIIERVSPEDKLALYGKLLDNEDAALRNEVLGAIAKTDGAQPAQLLVHVMKNHAVPQMRTAAMRHLPRYSHERFVLKAFLDEAKDEHFDSRPEIERKSLLTALAQMEQPEARTFFQRAFDQKSGMFRKKVDERKMLLIQALGAAASVPALQQLVAVSKDDKKHSKEVTEAAQKAATNVKRQLLGRGAGRGQA